MATTGVDGQVAGSGVYVPHQAVIHPVQYITITLASCKEASMDQVALFFQFFSTVFAVAIILAMVMLVARHRDRRHVLFISISYGLLAILDALGWTVFVYKQHDILAAMLSITAYIFGIIGIISLSNHRKKAR